MPGTLLRLIVIAALALAIPLDGFSSLAEAQYASVDDEIHFTDSHADNQAANDDESAAALEVAVPRTTGALYRVKPARSAIARPGRDRPPRFS